MQLNAYLSMQPFRTGDAYWLRDYSYLASVIDTKDRTNQIIKGGGGDVICAHPRTQGRSSSNTRPSQRRNNCTLKSKDEFHSNIVFSVNLTKYLQQDERVRGFGVDRTLTSK